jgi:PAS domain S-box-containing protein
MTTRDLESMSKEELIRELEAENRELREAQRRLQESRERYAELYEFAPVGYCTLDAAGCIQEINLAGAALLGAPRTQLEGRPFSSVAPLKDRAPLQTTLRRCLERRERSVCELVLAGPKRTRTIQMICEPVRTLLDETRACRTALIEISDLKQLENNLRILAEAGRTLTSSLEPAITLETAAHLVVPALADLFMADVVGGDGVCERQVVVFGDSAKQRRLAEPMKALRPRAGWQTAQARAIASSEPMLLSEAPSPLGPEMAEDERDRGHANFLRSAGIRSLMVVPFSARGKVHGALTLAITDSDRRYSPMDLNLALDLASRVGLAVDNARLYEDAQKAVAARDDILALVSHDLRNPLNVITTNAQVLLRGPARGDEGAPMRKSVESMARSAQRMNRLIQDLLDFSSIRAGHFSIARSKQQAGPLVDEALEPLKPHATAKSVWLESRFPVGGRFDVDCDRDRVQQVLSNLVDNSIKFTEPGGTITVAVEPRGRDAFFEVTDTGCGIPESDLAHVFDRFWQADRTARMGAGLGLSIAKGIIEAHGGRMWVASQVGRGSTFTFTLPPRFLE